MSLKNLGVSLDLRGTPERIVFQQGFLKGIGVPLHPSRAGICEKARASAHKGRQLQAASSFPAVADVADPASLPSGQPPAAPGSASVQESRGSVSPKERGT